MVKVAIKTAHGKFLSAQPDGKLEANRDALNDWEVFELEVDAKGLATIRTAHGRYISAQPDGSVVADREHVNDWERFNADFKGHNVVFKSAHGKFVTAEAEKHHKTRGHVTNNRTEAKNWETFTVFAPNGGFPFIPGQKYAFRSAHGNYVCAEPDGKVVADRKSANDWEYYTVGVKGDSITLRSAHGKYLCAELNHALHANRDAANDYEHFHVHHVGHDKVALRTAHGRYLSAQPDGSIIADREHVNDWEHFVPQAL